MLGDFGLVFRMEIVSNACGKLILQRRIASICKNTLKRQIRLVWKWDLLPWIRIGAQYSKAKPAAHRSVLPPSGG